MNLISNIFYNTSLSIKIKGSGWIHRIDINKNSGDWESKMLTVKTEVQGKIFIQVPGGDMRKLRGRREEV